MWAVSLLEFLGFCAAFTGISEGTWRPQISSTYQPSRSSLCVRIAPPKPGAADYLVTALGNDNILVKDSSFLNKSDTELFYELKGFRLEEQQKYTVMVRARRADGYYLTNYLSSPTPVAIPPDNTHEIIATESENLTDAVPSTLVLTTSGFGLVRVNSEQITQLTGSDRHDREKTGGFHLEVWMIIVGGVVLFLLLVFVGVMVLVGCGGKSHRRRRSTRSQTSYTSQDTTNSTDMVGLAPMMRLDLDGQQLDAA